MRDVVQSLAKHARDRLLETAVASMDTVVLRQCTVVRVASLAMAHAPTPSARSLA